MSDQHSKGFPIFQSSRSTLLLPEDEGQSYCTTVKGFYFLIFWSRKLPLNHYLRMFKHALFHLTIFLQKYTMCYTFFFANSKTLQLSLAKNIVYFRCGKKISDSIGRGNLNQLYEIFQRWVLGQMYWIQKYLHMITHGYS